MFREEDEEEVGGLIRSYQNWPEPEVKQHSMHLFGCMLARTRERCTYPLAHSLVRAGSHQALGLCLAT
jgi:hypothetical protein